jgi:Cache 3/Cache 2 fusion domain
MVSVYLLGESSTHSTYPAPRPVPLFWDGETSGTRRPLALEKKSPALGMKPSLDCGILICPGNACGPLHDPSRLSHLGGITMDRKRSLAAACFVMMTLLIPSIGNAQVDSRVQKSMELLKSMTAKLGEPKLDGRESVGGKEAPVLHFGTTKINNNFEIVDAIGKEDGQGMTATLFAKGGDEYIRVATSVPKPDGSGRAIGTVLAGPALEAIRQGKAHYGDVPILGVPYTTGYEPIKTGSGEIIGVYYVGYKK